MAMRSLQGSNVGIAEFAESDEYCDTRIYPRQQVLLKLFFLEEMEGWEEDVLDEWIRGEGGVHISPLVRQRRDQLREQGYRHFGEIQLIGGRRGSKGFVTALAMTKKIYEVQQIPDPGTYFGIAKDKEIYFACVAASLDQAKKFQFADLVNVVSRCKPLLKPGIDGKPAISSVLEEGFNIHTDADRELVRELEEMGLKPGRDYSKLRAKPLPANARSIRGSASMVIVFDEMAHMLEGFSQSTGSEVYGAAEPSITQFKKHGLMFLNSSPYSKAGKFYEQTEIGFSDGNGTGPEPKPFVPHMLAFQWPSWALYRGWDKDPRKFRYRHVPFNQGVMPNPDMPDEEQPNEDEVIAAEKERLKEQANPETYRVEYRAQWAEVLDAYLNPQAVDRSFSGNIIIPEFQVAQAVRMAREGQNIYTYAGHLDPSSTTAGFGFAMGHAEEYPSPAFEGAPTTHVVLDFVKRWNPDDFPEGTIDYMQVMRELSHIINLFRPYEVTFDQYQSAMPIQWLRQDLRDKHIYETKVYESQGNNKQNWDKWEVLKTALNLNLVHIAPDCPDSEYAKQELKFLSADLTKQNPKVERQTSGPIQTKDIADCIRDVTYKFLGTFLEAFMGGQLAEMSVSGGAQGGYQIGGRQAEGPRNFDDFYNSRGSSGSGANPTRGMGHRRSRH